MLAYRRLFWKGNKDAVSASWRFFGRACERTFDKVFSIINEYLDEK